MALNSALTSIITTPSIEVMGIVNYYNNMNFNKKTVNKNTTVYVNALVKDPNGYVVPLNNTYLFTVTIKTPYGNLSTGTLSVGITGPQVSYYGITGPSQFFFSVLGQNTGDYKYKIQYDSTQNTGSYGPQMLVATVDTFRVVDDDF